ncbi:hypothetical protein TPAU25S_00895 [Tsukamurella paurometabola]
MERNPLYYDDTLNSAIREWLKRWGVHFVVLPPRTAGRGRPDSGAGSWCSAGCRI